MSLSAQMMKNKEVSQNYIENTIQNLRIIGEHRRKKVAEE